MAAGYRVTQEKDFGGRRGLLELRGLVGEDLAGRAVFARGLEALGVLEADRVKRERQYLLAGGGGIGGEGEEGHSIPAREGVWRDPEDGDVMGRVGGHDGGWEDAGRGVGLTQDEVGLAAVTEGLENMGVGEQVALLVDEEGVAEEGVVIAALGRGFIEAVDDRADRCVGRQVCRRTVGGHGQGACAGG